MLFARRLERRRIGNGREARVCAGSGSLADRHTHEETMIHVAQIHILAGALAILFKLTRELPPLYFTEFVRKPFNIDVWQMP